MNKKWIIAIASVVVVAIGLFLYPWYRLHDRIALPYLGHQKPFVDPHLPMSDPLSDKLDEVLFDGLFNVSATPSGIVYEDGLGELISIDDDFVVTVQLKPNAKWHSSYSLKVDGDEVSVEDAKASLFTAKDLAFTLRRIELLGSLSPDFILVYQALERMEFAGPDANGRIKLQFRKDRIWTDNDIKEVLSFKIVPDQSPTTASNFRIGTGPYLATQPSQAVSDFIRNPVGSANLSRVLLKPFVDNSTYPTELSNGNINVMLATPFGSVSPVLQDTEKFFTKSNIPTTFFAVLMNTERLNRAQRVALRQLLSSDAILQRFFRTGSAQQRHIVDYRGKPDQYTDLVNASVFPSTSYYVEEQIVTPKREQTAADLSVLPDTIKIKACVDFGNREELSELVEILNDPVLTKGRIRALSVGKDDIRSGNYDAVLMAFNGYRSTFLFDLYDIFLREPDPEFYRVSLKTVAGEDGKLTAAATSLSTSNNYCRMDATKGPEADDFKRFLELVYGFMATREIGDKQAYARFIDEAEQELGLGAWLFSLPSLSYFRTQFDAQSIDLYGVAAQLSTIEKWKEKKK
ncbi:MAG: hypothetical protein KDC45_14485 [Bacteroidetes bacterium]|nr:hypothetical protein [Bacteroidota bacterium]